MIELTITGGDDDAERTGYWTVTGPQDPNQVCAIIERTHVVADGAWVRDVHAWYLNQRTTPEYNSRDTYMLTIAEGDEPTFDDAREAVRQAWEQHIGRDAAPSLVAEPPAELRYSWRD